MHVPPQFLPAKACRVPIPLIAIFFLQRRQLAVPSVKRIGTAEAAARLFANTLNALAHKGEGLDGAIEIARQHFCFELTIADLTATCALVKNILQGLPNNQDYQQGIE